MGKSASVEPEHLVPLAAARCPDGALALRVGTWWAPRTGNRAWPPAARQAACKPW